MPSTLASLFRAARAVTLLGTLVLFGCGSPTPAPAYPSPEDPAIEDTEFAAVLGIEAEEEVVEEEDDWVDPSAGEETEEPEKR